MISISNNISIKDSEIEFTAVRAEGPGGQHVNKTSSAIHLRFDIKKSSLPDSYKTRLLLAQDFRVTAEGIIVIKAQCFRSQEQNKLDAIARLTKFIQKTNTIPKTRKKTKPTRQSVRRRLDKKTQRGGLKKLRQQPI